MFQGVAPGGFSFWGRQWRWGWSWGDSEFSTLPLLEPVCDVRFHHQLHSVVSAATVCRGDLLLGLRFRGCVVCAQEPKRVSTASAQVRVAPAPFAWSGPPVLPATWEISVPLSQEVPRAAQQVCWGQVSTPPVCCSCTPVLLLYDSRLLGSYNSVRVGL